MALLEIHDLHTFFKTKKGIVKAVNGVSYSVEPGKTLGVVGESGSGKSVSAMSILKLLDGNGYIDSGEIIFDGKNLADVSVKDMCKIRGNDFDDLPGADDQLKPDFYRGASALRAFYHSSGNE